MLLICLFRFHILMVVYHILLDIFIFTQFVKFVEVCLYNFLYFKISHIVVLKLNTDV